MATSLLSKTERFLENRVWRGVLLAIILVVGVALRLTHFGKSGIWRDEALFLFVSQEGSVKDVLHFLHYHESHPPLFYLLMRGYQAIFGASEQATILLPTVLGIAILPIGYLIASSVFGRTVGLAFTLILALSPGQVDNTRLVRPYSFLYLLSLISTHLLWKILTSSKRKEGLWALYAVLMTAMVYTHNWCWVVVMGQGIAFCFVVLRYSVAERWKYLKGLLLAQISIFLLYLPWVSTLLYQTAHAGHPRFVRSQWLNVVGGFLESNIGVDFYLRVPYILAIAVIILLGYVKLFKTSELFKDSEVITNNPAPRLAIPLHFSTAISAIAIASALMFKANLLLPYCLLIVGPSFCLGFVGWIFSISRSSAQQIICLALFLQTCFLCFQATLTCGAQYKSNAREVAKIITDHAKPEDIIIIAPEWPCSSVNYYLKLQNSQIDYPVQHRETKISFDDMADRVRDIGTWQTTKKRLRTLRDEKITIWFLTIAPSDIPNIDPEIDKIRTKTDPFRYRAIQIHTLLVRLYGKGETYPTISTQKTVRERITIYRFSPTAKDDSLKPQELPGVPRSEENGRKATKQEQDRVRETSATR